ncbi:MAG: quinone-dependent dihydroorotate dehydrogenase [Pelistega sp.]|nr:quinone-dependent dihydroorotate dehydrogenase [Pelistega sp.]
MFKSFNPYCLIRPALFSLEPEKAHDVTLRNLSRAWKNNSLRKLLKARNMLLPTDLMGLPLRNPIGLAAGLDKNGEYIDALGQLGFGFLEVGTVTPRPQDGNPKPRMFRLPKAEALINRMGFNNQGLDVFLANVARNNYQGHGGILGLNLGKNADTPIEKAADDYLIGLRAVYAYADYVTVNISSPNTQNLRALQGEDELSQLLQKLQETRKELADHHGRHVPIAIKIAPDLDQDQILSIAHLLPRYGMDGVIATNTTLSRDAVKGLPHAQETGGLSGPPVHELSLKVISSLRRELGPDFAIIGVGGINSGQRALEKVQAGANAIQLYTGLIYQGPHLIRECMDSLREAPQFFLDGHH